MMALSRRRLMSISSKCLTAIALSLMLTACGSSPKLNTQVSTSTTGQQLIDLKSALDQGVITQSQYDRKKKEILSGA
jgi:starvation-inducible outer membrane lipoprotein